ncbi:MAG: antibiotic ABC transporter permease, partial [Clostridiales bacterium]|nr:antibiotic ABC transporter permease [Clostridiales bacterium]
MIKKIAHALTRKPKLVALIAVLLLIPSALGYIGTRVNYDILSYLPEDLDSVQGERLLEEPFHMAATSMLNQEAMHDPYTNEHINEIKEVPGVASDIRLSKDDDIQIPTQIIPAALRDMIFAVHSTKL